MNSKKWNLIGFCLGVCIAIVIGFVFFPSLLDWSYTQFKGIDSSDTWTALLLVFCVIMSVNPLLIGYGFLVLGICWVYSWSIAILIVYPPSVVAGVLWFGCTRFLVKRSDSIRAYVERLAQRNHMKIAALQRAIAQNKIRVAATLQLT